MGIGACGRGQCTGGARRVQVLLTLKGALRKRVFRALRHPSGHAVQKLFDGTPPPPPLSVSTSHIPRHGLCRRGALS